MATMEMEISDHDDKNPTDYAYWPPRNEHKRRAKILLSTPLNIAKAYTQVISSYNNDQFLLAAIGIRAILEAICQYFGVDDNLAWGLKKKLNILRAQEILGANIIDALEQFKFLGDSAAHRLSEPPESVMSLALDVLDDLLVNQFEAQYRLNRSAEKLCGNDS